MSFFTNGRFSNWFGWLLGILGCGMGYYGFYVMEHGYLSYLFWSIGLVLMSISSYEARAVALGLRPFEKFTWRAAKRTYWPKVVNAKDQKTCEDFLGNLCEVEVFKEIREEEQRRWGPHIAPALLFASFGRWLALATEDELPAQLRAYVFDLVEKAITKGDEPLKAAIKLGFLEALAKESATQANEAACLENELGEVSRAFFEKC